MGFPLEFLYYNHKQHQWHSGQDIADNGPYTNVICSLLIHGVDKRSKPVEASGRVDCPDRCHFKHKSHKERQIVSHGSYKHTARGWKINQHHQANSAASTITKTRDRQGLHRRPSLNSRSLIIDWFGLVMSNDYLLATSAGNYTFHIDDPDVKHHLLFLLNGSGFIYFDIAAYS